MITPSKIGDGLFSKDNYPFDVHNSTYIAETPTQSEIKQSFSELAPTII